LFELVTSLTTKSKDGEEMSEIEEIETLESQEIWTYYKQVREERGYTLADVAITNPYLDKSQLSRFESGENMLSADRFLAAIKGLNMTASEFFALMASEPSSYHVFSEKYMKYAMAGDVVGLKALIKPNARMKMDKIFNILAKSAILGISEENLVTSSERKFLEKYLFGIKQWTVFEVNIFGMCLKILDEDDVYDLGQDMLASSELSQMLAQNAEVIKKMSLNLYEYLIYRGRYSRAERIEEKIERLITEWDLEEKISLYLYKKISRYKQEKSAELFAEIQSALESLREFGATGIANRIAGDIERYC
jgi:Rgg/GadR/MutR family transcriptional activator